MLKNFCLHETTSNCSLHKMEILTREACSAVKTEAQESSHSCTCRIHKIENSHINSSFYAQTAQTSPARLAHKTRFKWHNIKLVMQFRSHPSFSLSFIRRNSAFGSGHGIEGCAQSIMYAPRSSCMLQIHSLVMKTEVVLDLRGDAVAFSKFLPIASREIDGISIRFCMNSWRRRDSSSPVQHRI